MSVSEAIAAALLVRGVESFRTDIGTLTIDPRHANYWLVAAFYAGQVQPTNTQGAREAAIAAAYDTGISHITFDLGPSTNPLLVRRWIRITPMVLGDWLEAAFHVGRKAPQ